VNLAGRILRLPLLLIPRGVTVPVVRGPLRGMRWITGSHTHGCWLGTYEADVQAALVPHLRPGVVFYDLGANVGYYALMAARLGATVVAIEPMPRNLHYLRRHFEINGLTATVVETALLDFEGTARMASDPGPAFARISDHGQPVGTTTLDLLVYRDHLPAPHLVKCDTEGAEVAILGGAVRLLRADPPMAWLIATHGRERARDCTARLAAAGYAVETHEDAIWACRS
jgi:FkbM family methyltransferase